MEFCTDYRADDASGINNRELSETAPRQHYPFEPVLPALEPGKCTTTRMVVVLGKATNNPYDHFVYNYHDSGRTLLEFQACNTPVPTVLDSLKLSKLSPQYGGRLLNPKGVDIELLKFWLEKCERDHGQQCAGISLAPRLGDVTDLLFVDVVDKCVVVGSSTSRYTALSYVWGTTNNVVLTKGNYSTLCIKGSLQDISLPATIRDAITVAERMGIRLLWVDALCIRQDDDAHKDSQIAQMSSVYASAVFTIIAACGDHANAGLSRVSTPWNHKVDVINAPGVTLVPVLDSFDDFVPGQLSYSEWYSRAWTMQEHLLSTRKLIFAENQVYWHCPQSKWLEETELESGRPSGYQGYCFGWVQHTNDAFKTGLPSNGLSASHFTIQRTYTKYDFDISILMQQHNGGSSPGICHSLYEDLAIRYVNRQMTSESDRLNAFAGILKALSVLTGEKFAWGLPEGRFSYTLVWTMPGRPRTFATQNFQTEKGEIMSCPLPTWSWVAWGSTHTYDLYFNYDDEEVFREVVIYQLDAAGGRREIEDKTPERTTVSAGQSPQLSHVWKLLPVTIALSEKQFNPSKDRGQLQFWSSTAVLELCRGNADGRMSHLVIPDYFRGRKDDQRLDRCLREVQVELAPEDLRTSTMPNSVCDECKTKTIMADLVVVGSRVTNRVTNSDMTEWRLNTLIVSWENDVAYRIGIAKIPEYVWAQLKNRLWRCVTLG